MVPPVRRLLAVLPLWTVALGFVVRRTAERPLRSRHRIDPPTSSSLARPFLTTRLEAVRFVSPLVEDGYPLPDRQDGPRTLPVLLYLPGFDGTLLAPFLQFPELSTVGDVWGLTVTSADDRPTFRELRSLVSDFWNRSDIVGRDVYLMGESFGGLLALAVASDLLRARKDGDDRDDESPRLAGVVLINPATSYPRSALAKRATALLRRLEEGGTSSWSSSWWRYPFGLVTELLPLFVDRYGWPQLWQILVGHSLPSVIDTPAREAYMGRMAFSLHRRLVYLPPDALRWRLEEWLEVGCREVLGPSLSLSWTSDTTNRNNGGEEEGAGVLDTLASHGDLGILIVCGSDDRTLPSWEEAERLRHRFDGPQVSVGDAVGPGPRVSVHVVEGAGHASTCGSRVDLAALLRQTFPALLWSGGGGGDEEGRTRMKETAASGTGADFGMVPRYDGIRGGIGMLPTRYWDEDVYRPPPKSPTN